MIGPELTQMVWAIFLVIINLVVLAGLRVPLFQMSLGLLTPIVVLSADLPFSPTLPIIIILLSLFNIVSGIRGVFKNG